MWGTNENNVYAVGGVRLNDTMYGIIKWDGTEWKPEKRIGGLQAIWGFSENDIWAVGGGVWYYDGNNWTDIADNNNVLQANIGYTSLWGTSSSNLYLGNQSGRIIFWNGNSASIVFDNNGGTLNDIEGISQDFVIATGAGFIPPSLNIYYDGVSWKNYPYVDDSYSLNGVAIINRYDIYWSGDGVFETKRKKFSYILGTGYYVWDIEYNRQSGEIVVSGAYDGVHIYNGIEWRSFQGIVSTDTSSYFGIFLVGDKVFCVGRNDNQAKIIIGTRN